MQYPNFNRVSVTEGGRGWDAQLMFHCKWLTILSKDTADRLSP